MSGDALTDRLVNSQLATAAEQFRRDAAEVVLAAASVAAWGTGRKTGKVAGEARRMAELALRLAQDAGVLDTLGELARLYGATEE